MEPEIKQEFAALSKSVEKMSKDLQDPVFRPLERDL